MKTALRKIHRRIRSCEKCRYVLDEKVLPRSGFPPDNGYKAIIVGAEPGPGANRMMTPSEYQKCFMPGAKNTNTVRLLFEDLQSAGIDLSIFFYANAVKCPANPNAGQSKICFINCEDHLKSQLEAIKPQIIIVIGSAATYLGLKRARKDSIERDTYLGVPAIIIRHPQGASLSYRRKVIKRIKYNLSQLNITSHK
jgi:uracil-DNA glycosylase family 4